LVKGRKPKKEKGGKNSPIYRSMVKMGENRKKGKRGLPALLNYLCMAGEKGGRKEKRKRKKWGRKRR